jgi:hypothetical protein
LDSTLRTITDGLGTASPLNLSTTQVAIKAPSFDLGMLDIYESQSITTEFSGVRMRRADGVIRWQLISDNSGDFSIYSGANKSFSIPAAMQNVYAIGLNQPLDATLRAFTTGAATSPLQLSTTNVGILTSGDGQGLSLINGSSAYFNVRQDGPAVKGEMFMYNGATPFLRISVGNNSYYNGALFGIGLNSGISARLHVRGDGTNPIARFENSLGARGFIFNTTGDLIPISTNGLEFITTGYDGGFKLDGSVMTLARNSYDSQANVRVSLSSTYGGGFEIFPNIQAQTSGNIKILHSRGSFAAAAGSANYRPVQVEYTLNNSGAQTGTATGIFLNATETALNGMTHNLMALQRGGVSQFTVSRAGAVTAGNINVITNLYMSNYQSSLASSASGVIRLLNAAENDFNRLQFGGTTNAFPAIKRNGAAIDFRLADDSAFCNINAGNTILKGSTSNNAANALLVTNSSDTQILRVRNDGQVQIGTSSNFTVDGNTTFNRYELVVGALSAIPSAVLSATSTTQGFLPPRMTTTQKNAIASPAAGLVVYDTTLNKLCVFTTAWETVTSV